MAEVPQIVCKSLQFICLQIPNMESEERHSIE